jgi:transposase InsO family protein
MIERFFRSLKEECIWQHHFKTFEEAKAAIEAWVTFYPHQALGYLSGAAPRRSHTTTRGLTQGGNYIEPLESLQRASLFVEQSTVRVGARVISCQMEIA